jgi:gas vesicle protein
MFRSLALGLVLAALLLAGCGSDNPRMIDQQRAEALTATVDEIGQRTEAEECDGAKSAVREAKNQVQELPSKVSVRLKDNLNDWLNHIDEQVPKDCKPKAEATPTATETPDETETPSPTPTDTPDETPTPTPTPTATPTPLPEPTVEPPADPGDTGGVLPGDEG